MNLKPKKRATSRFPESVSVGYTDPGPMSQRLEFHARPGGPVEVVLSKYPGIASRYMIPRADARKMFRELSAYLERE